MATKKSGKNTKKNAAQNKDANIPLLFAVLLISVLILICIVYFGGDKEMKDFFDDTDTSKVTDSIADTDLVTEKEDSDTEVKAPETNAGDADTENTDAETDSDEETTDLGYTVETEAETQKSENGDAIMEYPTIDSPEKSYVDSEFINELIRDYMNEKLRDEQFEDSITDSDVTYRYEITDTETKLTTKDFLSILIKGEYYVTDTPHPTIFAYTINCDLKSKKIISAENLITDFKVIKDKFVNGEFLLVYGVDGLLDETNYSDMIMEYRTEYGIYPEIYFTEDSFGMVVDLVYALGGYAIFEIPYEMIPNSVKVPASCGI